MTRPLPFPDPQDEARRRAAEFQVLSPDERWQQMAAMMVFGLRMVEDSPRRAAIERRWADQENEWRKVQSDLIARHGG